MIKELHTKWKVLRQMRVWQEPLSEEEKYILDRFDGMKFTSDNIWYFFDLLEELLEFENLELVKKGDK